MALTPINMAHAAANVTSSPWCLAAASLVAMGFRAVMSQRQGYFGTTKKWLLNVDRSFWAVLGAFLGLFLPFSGIGFGFGNDFWDFFPPKGMDF